jgi:hypothetical protein
MVFNSFGKKGKKVKRHLAKNKDIPILDLGASLARINTN